MGIWEGQKADLFPTKRSGGGKKSADWSRVRGKNEQGFIDAVGAALRVGLRF